MKYAANNISQVKLKKPISFQLPLKLGKSERMIRNTAQKMIDRYVNNFGKGMLTLHNLGDSFATNHWKKNKDIVALKSQLGHTDVNTTLTYTHVLNNTLKDYVRKADQ